MPLARELNLLITEGTYHLLSKEIKALKRSHGLSTRLDILEYDMSLPAHLLSFHGNDVKDGAVGREKGVERESQVRFFNLVGQVRAI